MPDKIITYDDLIANDEAAIAAYCEALEWEERYSNYPELHEAA